MSKICSLLVVLKVLILGKQLDYDFKNIFAADNDQLKEIVSIDKHNSIQKQIQTVLAEYKNGTYITYYIQMNNFLVNNTFEPEFEIIQKIQYIPQQGEKCYQLQWISLEEIILFCVHNQLLQLIYLNHLYKKQHYDLNYTNPIYTLTIQYQDNVIFIFINLHLSQWQIKVLEMQNIFFYNFPTEFGFEPIETHNYNSQQFDQKIIKFLINSYNQLYILSANKEIYLFELQGSIVKTQIMGIKETNSLLLDIDIVQDELYLLIKNDNQCFVNEISFSCFTNDLQLMVIDRENFYLIENQLTIQSPYTNITYPITQQNHCLIRELRLLYNYGGNSFMSLIYLENDIPSHPMENQFEPISFEFNDKYFILDHYIKFKNDQQSKVSFNPFLYGPPFSLEILEDESDIIDKVNSSNVYQTCLYKNEYQFVKMLNDEEYIYQIENYIYYLVCSHEKSHSKLIIRKNQESIIYFQSIRDTQTLMIYFDDIFGKELHYYRISMGNEYQIIANETITLSTSIQTMKQYLNTININLSDQSKTNIIFEKHRNKIYQNNKTLSLEYQFFIIINDYIICTQNNISNGVVKLILIRKGYVVNVINKYTINGYKIIDIAMINNEEFVLLLKNSTDQEISMKHYYIESQQIICVREIPTYSFKPIEFVEKQQSLQSIKALNKLGELTLLIYDFSKKNQECLIQFIPYPNNVYLIKETSIHLFLNNTQNNNHNNLQSVQNYNFGTIQVSFKHVTQYQFMKSYLVTVQIDNLLQKANKTIKLVGLDYTNGLYSIKNYVNLKKYQEFEPINFQKLVYGPISEIACKHNCSLKSLFQVLSSTVYNNQSKRQQKKIRSAVIIDELMFLELNQSLLVVSLKDGFSQNFNYKIIQQMTEFNSFCSIQKLEENSVQQLIAIVCAQKIQKCLLNIEVYKWSDKLIMISQFSKTYNYQICHPLKKISIKNNIFFMMDNSKQWFLYQYDFSLNQFNIFQLQFQFDHNYEYFDYTIENSYLFFASINQNLMISRVNLTTKSVISEDSYPIRYELTYGINIKILHSSETKLIILYSQLTWTDVYHFHITDQKIELVNIQQLIFDLSFVQFTPIYYDQHKVIFSIMQPNEVKSEYYTCIYLINEKEKYTFPTQVAFSINILQQYNQNKFVYINETQIGEITIGNFYEISITSKNFEIEVSNSDSRINIPMIAYTEQNNVAETQFLIIISIGGLLCIIQWVLQKQNKLKYIDLN